MSTDIPVSSTSTTAATTNTVSCKWLFFSCVNIYRHLPIPVHMYISIQWLDDCKDFFCLFISFDLLSKHYFVFEKKKNGKKRNVNTLHNLKLYIIYFEMAMDSVCFFFSFFLFILFANKSGKIFRLRRYRSVNIRDSEITF